MLLTGYWDKEMGTRYFRTTLKVAIVHTSRYISINSSDATKILMTSGSIGISIFNQGSTPLVWGGTNISVNSGNYLFPAGRVEWTDVQDGFEFYVISDSNGTFGLAHITEYR